MQLPSAAGAVILQVTLLSQEPVQDEQDPVPVEQAMAAVDAWLASDYRDEALVAEAADLLLDAGPPALKALAAEVRAAEEEGGKRWRGLDAVVTRVGLGFMERQVNRQMVYAGQYDPLKPLQPWIGRFYLRLLLDTPQWFPDTQRSFLVPALRDLYEEQPPSEEVLDRMQTIAEDEEFEAQNLRWQLNFALAQWGRPRLANEHIADVDKRIAEADAEDSVPLLQLLADIYYQLRQYHKSVATHDRLLRAAAEAGVDLKPADYYNAACACALSGRVEKGLDYLERCVERQLSDEVDRAHRLDPKLFAEDPELEALRGTERFQELHRDVRADGGR